MRTAKRTTIGLGLVLVMAVSSAPAWAQDGDEAGASADPSQIPVTTKSGRPDLYLDMPYFIAGFEPEIVMTRGEEHFAGLVADDPTRLQLEGLLETVGAETEDMVSGYALVSQEDFFSFVVALRVDGVDPGTLAPAYVPILIEGLEDPSQSVGELGGKEVTTIVSVGDGEEYVELYVYDQGDTIWMVQGPVDVAEATLEGLPDPLEAD